MATLSELAEFDDLRRCITVLYDGKAEEAFLVFVRHLEDAREQWQLAVDNNMRLQRDLESAMKSMTDLEGKLLHARKLLEMESKARREAEHDRGMLEKKLYFVRDLLNTDGTLRDETRSKLDFLNQMSAKKRKSARLTAVEEHEQMDINSTGSILSDLSLTRSENDFLDRPSVGVASKPRWRKSHSLVGEGGTPTKRKSSTQKIVTMTGNEKIVAHTKVTVPQDEGPILAESKIEAIPQKDDFRDDIYRTPRKLSSPKKPTAPPLSELHTPFSRPQRQHNFEQKTIFVTQTCNHCHKNIRFGQGALRCRSCNIFCHADTCSKHLNIVCAPQSAQKPTFGPLVDYVTPLKPMIPALLVHCVNEIEKRGLKEVGIYRVSGSDRDVKALKEKFLRSKAVPCLQDVDVHVLCGCVKDFLRSLQDKLIPEANWADFSNAVQLPSREEVQKTLKKCVTKLPEANQDTLAFMMVHLQRIAECPEIKMPLDNLAKVFAPTLIASTVACTDQLRMFHEAAIQVTILNGLLEIPEYFWTSFFNSNSGVSTDPSSSDSDRHPGFKQETPMSIFKTMNKRKKKFYDTPPYTKKSK